MFNIFSLESLDESCKDYLFINVGTLSYDWPICPLECKQKWSSSVVLASPAIDINFHYLLVGAACIFLSQLLVPEEIC